MPTLNQRNIKSRKKQTSSSAGGPQLPPLANKILKNITKYFDVIEKINFSDYLFNPAKNSLIMALLIPIEIILNVIIVSRIQYTEIDWRAYMQEVEGFMNGTLDYYELKGDTGPLVYPAGFVYIYSLLYGVTDRGANVKLAQYIFIGIYLAFISLVFYVYRKTKRVPPIAFILMSFTSHRIHSIFVLRLFNDPIAVLFLFAAMDCFLNKYWALGCVSFSLAVSVKMNILLYAPALFIILVLSQGWLGAIKLISLCALVQLVLGAPFLLTFPISYIHRSFDLGRQFFYIWTVNWKFLPEEIFLDKRFQLGLLALHLICLLAFMNKSMRKVGGLAGLFVSNSKKHVKLSADFIIFTMFVSNFIGICFSRSLHYQFYVWYYHTFAYLLWSTKLPTPVKLVIFGVVELCWNVYPSNMFNSLALNVSHLTVLAGLWRALDDDATVRLGFE